MINVEEPGQRHEPVPTMVELRFAVDATEAPIAYPVVSHPDRGVVELLDVELTGPGLLATLVLPVGAARAWAGELFAAVSVAYHEATGPLTPSATSSWRRCPRPRATTPAPACWWWRRHRTPGQGPVPPRPRHRRPVPVDRGAAGRPGRTPRRTVQPGPRRHLGRRAAGRAPGLNPVEPTTLTPLCRPDGRRRAVIGPSKTADVTTGGRESRTGTWSSRTIRRRDRTAERDVAMRA